MQVACVTDCVGVQAIEADAFVGQCVGQLALDLRIQVLAKYVSHVFADEGTTVVRKKADAGFVGEQAAQVLADMGDEGGHVRADRPQPRFTFLDITYVVHDADRAQGNAFRRE